MQAEYPILIALGALLILSPLVKSLMERLGIPAMVGYIILGLLAGSINQQWNFVTPRFDQTFTILAQLGVVALLFRVGLKSHTRALLKKLPDASLIWLSDVFTNLVLGFIVAYYVLGLTLETSLVIATAFSATSVAVSVGLLDNMHKVNTARGQLLVDIAELDDLSGVLLLAILTAVISVLQQNSHESIIAVISITTFTTFLKLVLFIIGCYLFSHYLERSFTHFNRKWENSTTGLTISVLGAGLAIAAIAGYLGFSLAIGALFAGLAFSRDPDAVRTDAKFTYFYEFLMPFFFINIGIQIDPATLIPSLGIVLVLLIPAILGKFIGVATPALRIMKKHNAALLGISMIPRAEIAMVIMYQCHLLGEEVVPDEIFAAMVIVAVITSIFAPLVLRFAFPRQPV
jgi:Kef-type K+ transport system membrane component KefB